MECGPPMFSPAILRILHARATLNIRELAFRARSIVERLTPGIGGLEFQTSTQSLLDSKLERVVTGNPIERVQANRPEIRIQKLRLRRNTWRQLRKKLATVHKRKIRSLVY